MKNRLARARSAVRAYADPSSEKEKEIEMKSHTPSLHRPNTQRPGTRRKRYHYWPALALVLLAALMLWAGAAAASCNFLMTVASVGSADGQVLTPRGIATDSAGNVFVADQNDRVQKFNSSGVFQFKFATGGSSFGSVVAAFGVAVDSSNNVYVTDGFSERTTGFVQKFNSSGAFVTAWGTQGSGSGQFINGAGGVAADSAGNVYVADPGSHRLQKSDSGGTFITSWGSGAGSANGQFSGPSGVAIDASDNVYVADTGNNRIQKFDTSGTIITKGGSNGTGDGQLDT